MRYQALALIISMLALPVAPAPAVALDLFCFHPPASRTASPVSKPAPATTDLASRLIMPAPSRRARGAKDGKSYALVLKLDPRTRFGLTAPINTADDKGDDRSSPLFRIGLYCLID